MIQFFILQQTLGDLIPQIKLHYIKPVSHCFWSQDSIFKFLQLHPRPMFNLVGFLHRDSLLQPQVLSFYCRLWNGPSFSPLQVSLPFPCQLLCPDEGFPSVYNSLDLLSKTRSSLVLHSGLSRGLVFLPSITRDAVMSTSKRNLGHNNPFPQHFGQNFNQWSSRSVMELSVGKMLDVKDA